MKLNGLRHALLAAAAGICFVGVATAEPLDTELAYLLRNHPQLKGLRNQVESSKEGVNRAFAGYLPQVEFNGDYGYESTDSPARRAATFNAESLNTMRTKATFTATQLLFDGWRTASDYDAAKLTETGSEITLDNTTQQVMFEGISAYIDVLRYRRLVELATQNEETIKTQLNLENERVQRGSGIALDVLQSKSRLQIAREQRVAFEGVYANAITRYTQVFGHPPSTDSMATPEVAAALMPLSVDDAIAIGVVEHPEALNSTNLIDLAQERRRGAKSAYFPRLDLVGRFNYEDNVDGVESVRRDYSVIVRASWKLFEGFATRAAVAEAAYQYAASVDNRNFVINKIVEDVNLAWENLQTAQRRLALLTNAVNIAIEVHEARKKLREGGKETVLNVLDAQNEVFRAQINEAVSDYDTRTAAYRLLLAMGMLDPEHMVPGMAASAEADAETLALIESETEVEAAEATVAAEEAAPAQATTEAAIEQAAVEEADVAAVSEPVIEPATVTLVEPEPVIVPASSSDAEVLAIVEPTAETTEAAGTAEQATYVSELGTVTLTAPEEQPQAATIEYIQTPEAFDPNLSRSWTYE